MAGFPPLEQERSQITASLRSTGRSLALVLLLSLSAGGNAAAISPGFGDGSEKGSAESFIPSSSKKLLLLAQADTQEAPSSGLNDSSNSTPSKPQKGEDGTQRGLAAEDGLQAAKEPPATKSKVAKREKCSPQKKGDLALARLNVKEAEKQYRLAQSACPSADVLGALALCIYAQAIELDNKDPQKLKRLQESLQVVTEGIAYQKTPDQLVLRAGISGTLALVTSSKSEAARLFLDSHRYSSEALAMDPEHIQGQLVMGSWHKAASELNFVEKGYIRMSAGPIPDSSFAESRRILERVAEVMKTPTAYFHLAETYQAMKLKPELARTLKKCISAKPKNVDDLPVAKWCERMQGEL